jgi:hypothetical protein
LSRYRRQAVNLEFRMRKSGHPLAGRCQEQNKSIASRVRKFFATLHAIFHPQTVTAPVLSCCWLRCESHQTPVGIKPVAMLCDCPGGNCHPRETLVPSRVQGVAHIPFGCHLDDDASPCLAHGLGDSSICNHSDGAKTASKSFPRLRSSPLTWLTVFGQTVTRNIDQRRRVVVP